VTDATTAALPAPVTDPALAGIMTWFSEHARPLPWRQTRDVYAVWVSEVMSAQTTVARVAAAWMAWIARWPTVEALAGASLSAVLGQWQGLGYPRRARDLHRSAQIIVASGWPDDLTELPGVGPYVAAAVRCFALEQPVLPLDVNVRRVLSRRFSNGVDTAGDPWWAGQALMEFGQRVCTTRPDCGRCPVHAGCPGPGNSGTRAPRRCRPPFEGSLRHRRGQLLRAVLTRGGLPLRDADREAAEGLVADGLLSRQADWLRPPV
jgi:A/G-specific adenine glycosylase